MENYIDVSGRTSSSFKKIAREVALKVLKLMNQPEGLEVAITFVTEKTIQEINKEYRNIDRVTDVLSFPSTTLEAGEIFDIESEESIFLRQEDGLIHFGDMALCTKRLREQAKEYGNSPEKELKKLVIHSMLHLMGYDHIEDSDYEIMNKKEVELDKLIKIEVVDYGI